MADVLTDLTSFFQQTGGLPTVVTANIPEFVRSDGKTNTVTANPHASNDQVLEEILSLAVDKLGQQFIKTKQAGKKNQFTDAVDKLLARIGTARSSTLTSADAGTNQSGKDFVKSLVAEISSTAPRQKNNATNATELSILLDLANRTTNSRNK